MRRMAMTIGVNPNRKSTNEKKSRKKVKGRNTIRSVIDIDIHDVIVVMRAAIVTIAMATILIPTLKERKSIVVKGIRESIESENTDEGPPKAMIQAMTRDPRTLPLMMAIILLAEIKDAKGEEDHLETKIIEAITRKETVERKDGKMKRGHRRSVIHEIEIEKSVADMALVAVRTI
jgi:hypothetical protein